MSIRGCMTVIIVSVLFAACDSNSKTDSTLFEKGISVGVNNNKKLEEASGLIASINHPGWFWTHNDSGHPAKLFLIDEKAKTKKSYELAGINNRDWEDIAMGPGPIDSVNYIYVGDIGDNFRKYEFKYLYRLPEPADDQSEEINQFDKLTIKFDDGIFDSEAFICDPITKNIYLFSKQQKKSGVYEIKFPFTADTLVAHRLYDVPFESVNAADISRDGREVLIKNYDEIFYWKKSGEESVTDLMKSKPVQLDYKREPQGEAIAWAGDGSGFYTLGENAKGERARLYYYKRK